MGKNTKKKGASQRNQFRSMHNEEDYKEYPTMLDITVDDFEVKPSRKEVVQAEPVVVVKEEPVQVVVVEPMVDVPEDLLKMSLEKLLKMVGPAFEEDLVADKNWKTEEAKLDEKAYELGKQIDKLEHVREEALKTFAVAKTLHEPRSTVVIAAILQKSNKQLANLKKRVLYKRAMTVYPTYIANKLKALQDEFTQKVKESNTKIEAWQKDIDDRLAQAKACKLRSIGPEKAPLTIWEDLMRAAKSKVTEGGYYDKVRNQLEAYWNLPVSDVFETFYVENDKIISTEKEVSNVKVQKFINDVIDLLPLATMAHKQSGAMFREFLTQKGFIWECDYVVTNPERFHRKEVMPEGSLQSALQDYLDKNNSK